MGPDYAHAEARKSPALDGKVERDSEGKEVRYPVMLSAMEKLVARKVCLAFKVGGDVAATSRSAPSTSSSQTNVSRSRRSKLCAASISSEPTGTRTCVTSTASAL